MYNVFVQLFETFPELRKNIYYHLPSRIHFSDSPIVRNLHENRDVFPAAVIYHLTVAGISPVDDYTKGDFELSHGSHSQREVMEAKGRRLSD